MTERTYTREEMKQAWQNAYAWGWYDACAEAGIRHRIDIGPLNERRAQQHSPYEQEQVMNTNESETTMAKHTTTVTDGGTRSTCTCGWYSRWATADGSAYEDAAAHKRRHAREEA